MSGAFTFEVIDQGSAISVHGELSLALDRQGNPSVAYALASGAIMLARRSGGAWTREELPSGSTAVLDDTRIRLAIDSRGSPHVAFRHQTGVLVYAVKRDNQWSNPIQVSTALSGGPRPAGIAAFDMGVHPGRLTPELRDIPQLVYADLTTGDLGYTQIGGTSHAPMSIAQIGKDEEKAATQTGLHASMTFDPGSEEMHIAYVSHVEQESVTLVTLRRKRIIGTQPLALSPATDIEKSEAINVLSTSIVRTGFSTCIAYFDLASRSVKAFFESADLPGCGRIEPVDSNIGATVEVSAAANRGQFRITYADANAIKLASRDRVGAWAVESVEAVSGKLPSLAYDNAGTANLAYATGGALKFARRVE